MPPTVLNAVDQFLRVFDADAELKCLLFHRHATAAEHRVGVAGTMADGQKGDLTGDIASGGAEPGQAAVTPVQILDAAVEPHFAAESFNSPADRLDHGRQAVAAEVRPVFVKDRRLAL